MSRTRGMAPPLALAVGFGLTLYVARGVKDNYTAYARETLEAPYVAKREETQLVISQPAKKKTERRLYQVDDFSKDNEHVLLARMIYGEARSCSTTEREAIAYTAVNRANDGIKWNGETVREALLVPWQYSCFNANDSNRKIIMDPMLYDQDSFNECLVLAEDVLAGKGKNIGATHYYDSRMKHPPSWAKRMERIGRLTTKTGISVHEFFKETPKKKKSKKTSMNDSFKINEYSVQERAHRLAA